jgi:hypothetical protein
VQFFGRLHFKVGADKTQSSKLFLSNFKVDRLRFNITYLKILLISCLLFGCVSKESNQLGKIKPKNVPDSSFWIGGIDDGNWYYVKNVNNHRNMARIAVYNDQTGALIIDAGFILVCNLEKDTFIIDLKKQISSFDGYKIYFIKSDSVDCYLQPIQ